MTQIQDRIVARSTTTRAPDRPQRRIGIVTIAEDLHAHVVRKALAQQYGADCVIIETDCLPHNGRLEWSPQHFCAPTLPTLDGGTVDVRSLDLIWWRRSSGVPWRVRNTQALLIADEAAADVVKNDSHAALRGLLMAEFRGLWISDPESTARAENKLLQLQAAQRAGLPIANTLVSQNPQTIRAFCAQQRTVVKTIAGTTKTALMAHEVSSELLANDEALSVSPAIYQALVGGRDHLRVHVFGPKVLAARLRCEELDWRVHLDRLEVTPFEVPRALEEKLRHFLALMNLRMGVFDLKIDDAGNVIWLEVNPQGQFLFVEGMLPEMALGAAFASFLHESAQAHARAQVLQ